ncbi:MAG TPA: hypothetical protein VF669_01050 [Tepidisphaeraceae bacterium]|jgi:hypothetical protein
MTTQRHILVSLIAMVIAFIAGCSFQMSVGKKPEPANPVQSSQAPAARTIIEVPHEAQLVGQGSEPLRVAPDSPGTVYVFSRDDRQVVLQYDLLTGEVFELMPGEQGTQFTADRHAGDPGKGTVPPSKGGYEVYFLRKEQPPTTTTAPAPAP